MCRVPLNHGVVLHDLGVNDVISWHGDLREDAARLTEPLLQVFGVDGCPSQGGALVHQRLVQSLQCPLCRVGGPQHRGPAVLLD
ncbi:hypothetical protein GCM10017744_000840 [Streptomyces antimycoticus]